MSGWKLVGISDESTECEVCGRIELKATHHIIREDGSELRAGSSCAARKLGVKAADINRAARQYRTRLEIARCNFPDWFRSGYGIRLEDHIRQHGRSISERAYKRYMQREGFTV
ncbi:hypothetical protein AB0G42_21430 [Streptomyces yangpuensis]|uniref:hypothetical protein n=1 Tax=Streptomyces yangpuensis TaxID=1648182 RepID=UPI0034347DBF